MNINWGSFYDVVRDDSENARLWETIFNIATLIDALAHGREREFQAKRFAQFIVDVQDCRAGLIYMMGDRVKTVFIEGLTHEARSYGGVVSEFEQMVSLGFTESELDALDYLTSEKILVENFEAMTLMMGEGIDAFLAASFAGRIEQR